MIGIPEDGFTVRFYSKNTERSQLRMQRWCRGASAFVVVLMLIASSIATAERIQTSPASSEGWAIRGAVHDRAGVAVPGAAVRIEGQGLPAPLVVKTGETGAFEFSAIPKGRFLLNAENLGWKSHDLSLQVGAGGNQTAIDLVLDVKEEARAKPDASAQTMEFSDSPTFTVAGVSDWTAAGGHGSDSALRTSEDLARNTLTLKPNNTQSTSSLNETALRTDIKRAPESFEANHRLGEFYLKAGRSGEAVPLLETAFRINPANRENEYDLTLAYSDTNDLDKAKQHVTKLLQQSASGNGSNVEQANLHRLAGVIDEKLSDPLASVREEGQAVRLDPSEQNYFSLGSELLLHRAIWQAAEVFKDGVKAYPKSARMLSGLGAALFAGAEYEKAADRLCEASDLNPSDPETYLFMGKIDRESPSPSVCIEQRLARFVQQQPSSATANYLYAMALWKRKSDPQDSSVHLKVEDLLAKALSLDSRCADAALQLGILAAMQGNYATAVNFYEKAIAANPELGEAHYRLGVVLDRTGQSARAKSEFLLHDALEKKQADEVERQREQIKQFQIVLQTKPGDAPSR